MASEQIILQNQTEELTRLAEWVKSLPDKLEISETCLFRLDLILTEAVTNIISYGYPQGGEHSIEIKVDQEDHSLSVKICDDGLPFNPLDHPAQPTPCDLAEAPVGGLGILLIRSFSTDCFYQRDDSKNVLTVTVQN